MKKTYTLITVIGVIGIITFISSINVNGAPFYEKNIEKSFLLSGFVPFLSLIILIGGSILITLSYVSWRKYKASKLKSDVQKRKSNN